MLGRAQRLAALRITRCYRTVSTATALLLAEMPPADLMALEREAVRKRRNEENTELAAIAKQAREAMLESWQSRWESEVGAAGSPIGPQMD